MNDTGHLYAKEFAALDAMEAAGEHISRRALRVRLGVGSDTTLGKALKAWRELRTPAAPSMPTAVDPHLERVAKTLWEESINKARATVAEETHALQQEQARLRADIEALEARCDQAQEQVEESRATAAAEREARLAAQAHLQDLQEAYGQNQRMLADAHLERQHREGITTQERERFLAREAELSAIIDEDITRLHKMEIDLLKANDRIKDQAEKADRNAFEIQKAKADLQDSLQERRQNDQMRDILEDIVKQHENAILALRTDLATRTTERDILQSTHQATKETLDRLLTDLMPALQGLQQQGDATQAAHRNLVTAVEGLPIATATAMQPFLIALRPANPTAAP